jgi:hypothetical protein
VRITGNEIVDEEAKATLDHDLLSTEKYPPQQLIKWIKTEDKKTRKTRWQNSENVMKNKKKEIEWNEDMKKMKRRDQFVILRLRTGLTMATHGYIINKQDNNECPFCNLRLTVDYVLWDCKETEVERERANIQNNIWDKGEDGMKELIEYVKQLVYTMKI